MSSTQPASVAGASVSTSVSSLVDGQPLQLPACSSCLPGSAPPPDSQRLRVSPTTTTTVSAGEAVTLFGNSPALTTEQRRAAVAAVTAAEALVAATELPGAFRESSSGKVR